MTDGASDSVAAMLVEFGGVRGGRPVVLLHGLMGRATTWWRVAQWLLPYGRVVGVDARAHGRNPHRGPAATEDFVADIADVLRRLGPEPAVLIGHSMGGLHALVTAARHPDLVAAAVVEDMAVDLRGRTVEPWRAYFDSWPESFTALAEVREFFGGAGDYFTECVQERQDGYHLIADLPALYEIAAEWGRRSYWEDVDAVRCPLLAVEAEHGIVPDGQLAELVRRAGPAATHVRVPGAAHIVHDDAPEQYRAAVEGFLRRVLPREVRTARPGSARPGRP